MHSSKKRRSIPVRILRAIGIVLLCAVILLAGLIGFLSVTEYKPEARETLEMIGKSAAHAVIGTPMTVVTWNIGYSALGDNADFFMDGGKMVHTADKARVQKNLDDIVAQIRRMQPDVVLLQEVDRDSARSCHVNTFSRIADSLQGFTSSFANNFKVAFLPYPVPPIGKVDSGVATFSAFSVSEAERIQLPIPFSWPVRMANLKRCLLVSRLPIENSDRELVLVNLHLEAYDDGEGRAAQTKMLAELLEAEAKKGNYVIAGGDFNQTFSNADASAYTAKEGNWHAPVIDVGQFTDGWQFLMDDSVPSCRSLYKPYAGADTQNFRYYLLDGLIVSGNVNVQSFGTEDLGFVSSDHNPVRMQITLQ